MAILAITIVVDFSTHVSDFEVRSSGKMKIINNEKRLLTFQKLSDGKLKYELSWPYEETNNHSLW